MSSSESPAFPGFPRPQYTRVPDVLFDELLPDLSGAELKVLLYICRRTFGFEKASDNISQSQMQHGIRTRDGRQLDRGTGLSRDSIWRALSALVEKGMVIAERRFSLERGDEATSYRLRFLDGVSEKQGAPVSENRVPPDPIIGQARTRLSSTQETVEQQTDRAAPASLVVGGALPAPLARALYPVGSKDRSVQQGRKRQEVVERETVGAELRPVFETLARELADEATLAATLSRAAHLVRRTELNVPEFLEHVEAARRQVLSRSGRMRRRNRMPYFFAVLEQFLGLRPLPDGVEVDAGLYERPRVSLAPDGLGVLQLRTLLYRAATADTEEARIAYRLQAEAFAEQLDPQEVELAQQEARARVPAVAEQAAEYVAGGEEMPREAVGSPSAG